jgi:murein DD-endopeptidase MepM/ murein hydrolase activator NlpD
LSWFKIVLFVGLVLTTACKFELIESEKSEPEESQVVVVTDTTPEPKEEIIESVPPPVEEASEPEEESENENENEEEVEIAFGTGGDGLYLKVPVPTGYDWEVTQSWSAHCSDCEEKYSDWSYCSLSHMGNCCRYGIDFNLPGYGDRGKPVLASGDGLVKELGYNNGWGYFVLLDHGANVCTRYAHLGSGSTDHLSEDEDICQGLKIGEIGNSGASEGPHLHFQFEDCETGEGLARAFDDGNEVPVCTRGSDRYDEDGSYSFLQLNNIMRLQCGASEPRFSGAELPLGGWYEVACGHIPDCPLVVGCDRNFNHQFEDHGQIDWHILPAANYLWRECAVNGRNGQLQQHEWLTRAEALKIPLFLFGLMEECGVGVNFEDVAGDSWYYPVVACGIQHGIVDDSNFLFHPNREVTLAEAAKFVVESAVRAELIQLQRPQRGHFPNFGMGHWAFAYIETLYAYGGLIGEVERNQRTPDDQVERGDYVVMVASLSPCFCPNVSCDGDCSCDQESFSCGGGENIAEHGGANEVEEEKEDEEIEVQPEPVEPYYLLEILGPDGWFVRLSSLGVIDYFELGEETLEVSGPEEDLPIALLIQGGPGNLYIDQFEPDDSGFGIWNRYEGGLTMDPAEDPYIVTHSFESHINNLRVLIKLPGD